MKKWTWLLSINLAGLTLSTSAAEWTQQAEKLEKAVPILFSGGGLCSGSLVSREYVLTAWHCVDRLLPIEVAWQDDLKNGTKASVARINKSLDLALLKLETPSDRPTVAIAKSNSLQVGQAVATMGHPMALKPFSRGSVDETLIGVFSTGVVSKVNTKKKEFVTDMSISPGNSGGPVVNAQGELVGVVSRKHMGMGVGQIGIIPGPEGINQLVDDKADKAIVRPRWMDADTRAGLILTGSEHSLFKDLPNLDSWLTGVYFHLDLFDRLRIAFEDSFDESPDYDAWGFGWAFHFPLARAITMSVVPAWEQWTYHANGAEVDYDGYSLAVEFSGFPLRFRWSQLDGPTGSENIFTVGLNLGLLGR